jgi:hypothetical protein
MKREKGGSIRGGGFSKLAGRGRGRKREEEDGKGE